MKGFVLAEEAHVVNILPAVDITGGKVCQAFSMKHYQHASILINVGVSAAAWTAVIVSAGLSQAPIGTTIAGAVAIAFNYYEQVTGGSNNDVLSARKSVAATGITSPSANDGIFYVIELDANELPDGLPFVQLSLTNGSNSVIASATAVLTGARYAETQSGTETS
jgi:hypothetical protein